MNVLHGRFDLTGRVALITGGSRGLGLQLAEGLSEFGARVVLVDRLNSGGKRMTDIFIVAGVRIAVGAFGGALGPEDGRHRGDRHRRACAP
jgi:gluconate 5-dehydrogenase